MRMHAQTAVIENGFVHVAETAPWLAEYLHDLAVFPNGKHEIRPIQPHSSSIGLKGRSQAKASSNRRDAERGRRRTRSWVRLQAPPGIGAVQTLHSRQHLTVGLDGTVEMWAEDESAGPYSQNGRHEDAAAERSKPQPVQTAPQPGSMGWFEGQNKKG